MNDDRAPEQSELELWRSADAALDRVLDAEDEQREQVLDSLPPEVRQLVERMLSGERDGSLLDSSPTELAGGMMEVEAEEDVAAAAPLAGRRLGPYDLREELGRGGMSVVYRAQRVDADYERDVAVKLLAVGELGTGGGARFAQEAQVLARLQHPGIATLLDAGVADDGTPWLAMELIEGHRIDRWCEDRELEPRGVVELVLQVVDAVSAAHRQLVVHRDLKPGNVLVDEAGRTRLLDFGIAKLVDEGDVAERTSTRVLTPEYGAPEQLSGEPVSTATDVHGLGALLFRLLTGEAPFEQQVSGRGVRTLRRASGRVADLEPDLMLVVYKALREEPERRYETAAEFAADLRNWLELRPVSAAPDSLAYRLRKLVRRRRGGVLAAAAVTAAILLGIGGTLWQARRVAEESRRTAAEATRADAVSGFLRDLFASASPDAEGGRELRVVEALQIGARRVDAELREVPDVRAEVLATIATMYRSLGLFDDALAALDRLDPSSLDDGVQNTVLLERSRTLKELDRFDEASQLLERLAERRERGRFSGAGEELEYLVALGDQRLVTGDFESARAAFREAAALVEGQGLEGVQAVNARLGLAAVAYDLGELQVAEAEYAATFAELDRVAKGDHTLRAQVLFAHGVLLSEQRRDDEAIAQLTLAEEMYARLLGEQHHEVADVLTEIATVHGVAGRFEQAEQAQRRAYGILVEQQGATHRDTLLLRNSMGLLAYRRGDAERATGELREVVSLMAETLGAEHPLRLEVLVNLGAILRVRRQFDEARSILEEAEGLQVEKFGEAHGAVVHSRSHLGGVHQALGDLDEALIWYDGALSSARAVYGDGHPEALAVLLNGAMVRHELGEVELAGRLGAEALEGFEGQLENEDPLLNIARARIARLFVASGHTSEALELADRAELNLVARLGESHGRVREARMARGQALLALGRREDGRLALEQAIKGLSEGAGWEYAEEVRAQLASLD